VKRRESVDVDVLLLSVGSGSCWSWFRLLGGRWEGGGEGRRGLAFLVGEGEFCSETFELNLSRSFLLSFASFEFSLLGGFLGFLFSLLGSFQLGDFRLRRCSEGEERKGRKGKERSARELLLSVPSPRRLSFSQHPEGLQLTAISSGTVHSLFLVSLFM